MRKVMWPVVVVAVVGIWASVPAAVPQVRDRTAKRIIHPPEFRADRPFSPGVLVDRTLYVSGQIGTDLKSGELAKTFEGEVRQTLDNIGLILKAADMDFGDVVAANVYLTDAALFADMNAVYTQYFKAERPARATVQTGLVGPAKIEISVVAHK